MDVQSTTEPQPTATKEGRAARLKEIFGPLHDDDDDRPNVDESPFEIHKAQLEKERNSYAENLVRLRKEGRAARAERKRKQAADANKQATFHKISRYLDTIEAGPTPRHTLEAAGKDSPPTDSKHPPLSDYVVDMSFDVDTTKKLEALLWRDDDDETLLYAGKLNTIFGLPASGKTWVSLIAAQNALANLGRVLVLDYEDNAVTFKTRMLKLGCNPAEHQDQLKYVSRTDLMENPDAVAEAQAWFVGAEAKAFNLVVIDSVGSAGCPMDGGGRYAVVFPTR